MTRRPLIGVSASFMHPDPKRNLYKGKRLLFVEESLFQWIMAAGAVPVLLPRGSGPLAAAEIVEEIDGLVLQGGADMSPTSYGETAARPEWEGDAVRDAYEIELVKLALATRRPLFGVCRGAQVLNVALGGTLWQDIESMHPGQRVHRNWDIYDEHIHDIAFAPGSLLERWYGPATPTAPARVNSVHHQGIKEVGDGLVVEARSLPDDIVEAIRYAPPGDPEPPFAYAVQWHPEFISASHAHLLSPRVLLDAFVAEVAASRERADRRSR